jgi:hypothetical protein
MKLVHTSHPALDNGLRRLASDRRLRQRNHSRRRAAQHRHVKDDGQRIA